MIKQLDKDVCLGLYRSLRLTRRFDETTIELWNQGVIIGPLHPAIGMEAIGVGICTALKSIDFICPTHRTISSQITRGIDIRLLMAEFMGKSSGYHSGKGGSMHISPLELGILGVDSVIGSRPGLGAGLALASKLRGDEGVTVAFYGDGGANEGIVHESMNIAAIWQLPLLFVCENNQYAYTTSAKDANAVEPLSRRAEAYGFTGQTIDGMDVVAVYVEARQMVEKIRSGSGPLLLECHAFDFKGHWSGESQQTYLNYRTKEEVAHWEARCPVLTHRSRLLEGGISTEQELSAIDEQVERLIEEAVEFGRNSEFPNPDEALKHVYATAYKGIPQPGWISV